MAFTREDAEKKCIPLGKNGQYLEVKWRIVWFRENCPNGVIETEMIHFDPDREGECEITEWVDNPKNPGKKMPAKKIKKAYGMAVFRATIADGNGGKATATKSETAASFEDYLEKAETGAIGRALALLGYGTQFTGDELAERHRIVDAPVKEDTGETAPALTTSMARQTTSAQSVAAKPTEQNSEKPEPTLTVAQLRYMARRELGNGAFDDLRGKLQSIYTDIDLKVDDAWQDKHCKHMHAMIKRMVENNKKQPVAAGASGK